MTELADCLLTLIKSTLLAGMLAAICWSQDALAQSLRVEPIGTEITQNELAEITRTVAYQRRKLQKLYGQAVNDTVYAKVFGDFGEFSDYTVACCDFQPISTAYFNEKASELVVFKNEEFMKALGHELCHALTAKRRIKNHPWLDEGLADVLSAKRVLPGGKLSEQLLYYGNNLKAINTPKIKSLMAADREKWQQMTNADSYAMSWAVVNFLNFRHPALLSRILLAADEQTEITEVIETHHKGGLKAFIKSMRAFYRSK